MAKPDGSNGNGWGKGGKPTDPNQAPAAVDDLLLTDEATALLAGVLLNDSDPDGDLLTVSALNGSGAAIGSTVTLTSGATVAMGADGQFTYDPNGAFDALTATESATDTFTYTVSDGRGGSDTATVVMTIAGLDPPPPPPPEEPPSEDPPPEELQTLRMEAEAFTTLGDFRIESLGDIASNGAGIRLQLGSEGAAPDASATASTAFTGGSGTYAIKVRYFDEGDGQAGLSLAVNGVPQANWTLDASGVGWTPDSGNGRTYTLSGVSLKTGDTIALTGTRDGEEYTRVDYVEFVPASGDDTGGGGGGTVGTEAIMPLGDSITDGDNNGGYRGFLYKQLTAESYDVDFVGTLERGASDVDPDHEGHSGWTIGQIHTNLTTFLDLNPPETVLLMIGTNNILGGQSAEDATAALSNLLNTLFDQAPEVDLFLGELTPIDPDRWSGATPAIAAEAEAYNALLPGVVSAQQTQGHSVTLVPMDNITTADLVDGVHPGQGGFATIADNYYQAMLGTDALDDALLL